MKNRRFKAILILVINILISVINPLGVFAENNLKDYNQDGTVSILGFGDSLTFGIGDNYSRGQTVETIEDVSGVTGYVGRLEQYLGVPVDNNGLPGEIFIDHGDQRALGLLFQSSADIFILLEGSNDAGFQKSPELYQNRYQRLVNQINRTNKKLLALTIPVPCCNHSGQDLFVNAYNNRLRALADANAILVADIDLAFQRACINPLECDLLNLPEGLHPNKEGYDLMAQVIAAKLLGIEVFSSGGNQDLEQALGLPKGTIPDLS